jgi:hypothetical protein
MQFKIILMVTGFCATSLIYAGKPDSIKQPDSIKFGQSVNAIKSKLTSACEKINLHDINPPELPGTVNSQTQLDCHGFEFAGKKRLAEFVFKDDQLFLTWVLIDAQDIKTIEKQMNHAYGSAVFENPIFSAFTHHHTAIRKDVPEVLFYSKAAAPQFEAWFKSIQ